MGCSITTIRFHRANILSKTGMKNAAELTAATQAEVNAMICLVIGWCDGKEEVLPDTIPLFRLFGGDSIPRAACHRADKGRQSPVSWKAPHTYTSW